MSEPADAGSDIFILEGWQLRALFRGYSHNLLLAAMSNEDREQVIEAGEVVSLRLKQILHEPGNSPQYLYFPFHGVVSMLTLLEEDGAAVEVATVGSEGMADAAAYHGIASPVRWLVQVSGDALRIEFAKLQEISQHSEGIRDVFNRYMVAMFILVSQTAACNRRHAIEERCARWLLMTHDRVAEDDFPMTHEFLSDMLGTRRAGVSIAMKALRETGVITYKHGRVTVLDRAGLQDAACECHLFVTRQFEALFPNEY